MRTSFHLTADVAVFRNGRVLLIRRRKNSRAFPNQLALPGGHVDKGETVTRAAVRELREETGLEREGLHFVGYFDRPGRDPRGDYVSFLFATFALEGEEATAGDDAQEVVWWPVDEIVEADLAFDHEEMVKRAWEEWSAVS